MACLAEGRAPSLPLGCPGLLWAGGGRETPCMGLLGWVEGPGLLPFSVFLVVVPW